ncbi:MAG: hypothetical protein H6810_01565 [Phycisphaeraceae bacterium]|nr:MAG: hypothetical protein H6810_01565 [Phycisphaeraceae bacterium]
MGRHRMWKTCCIIACVGATFAGSAAAEDLLRLWGIDADDAQLFAIDDVNNPERTFTDFGEIRAASGHRAERIDGEIRAFTIVNTFDAYAVVNGDVGGCPGPVLLHVDLEHIEPGIPVVADVVGSLADAGLDPAWAVTGIAGDPLFGVMYVLSADGDPTTDDRLARIRVESDRSIHAEPLGPISWQRGGVRMGADVTLGPAGLLLVADESDGRIVMVDRDTGEVRGVRLEGLRVDTDVAAYAGVAWDGYNDRTAMFDRRTGMLVVDDRTTNAIVAFDLADAGVRNAEGLEFVFRPTPPGEGGGGGAGLAMGRVSNVPHHEHYGSRTPVRPSAGGGGGGGHAVDPSSLIDSPTEDAELADTGDPEVGADLPDDPYSDPGRDYAREPGDPGDEPGDSPSDTPVVPAPGAGAILTLGFGLGARRRRR